MTFENLNLRRPRKPNKKVDLNKSELGARLPRLPWLQTIDYGTGIKLCCYSTEFKTANLAYTVRSVFETPTVFN